jgi:DNA-binding LacI/PurR family transcriptional regulator
LSLAGFEYLIELMDNPETPLEQRLISPELVIRESSNGA